MNAEANGSSGISLGRIRAAMSAFALGFGALIVAAAVIAAGVAPAEALPSYARQTGQPCAACHTAFPELTPFGRRFKIGGYTMGGGDWKGPPVAAMYMPSFTHTQSNQDSPPAPGLHTNDNLVSQQVSGFIAGQLYGNVGSFIQITSDPTVAGTTFVDASDVRYADTLKLFGKDIIWGLDANNTPTVEDPWNTTASFGWPQISSTIAPAFGPPLTHIENGYGQIVGGAGAYLFWDDMVYLDFTAYKGLPQNVLYAFNEPGIRQRLTRWRTSRLIGASRSSRIGATFTGRQARSECTVGSLPAANMDTAPTIISTSDSTRKSSTRAINTA